MHPLTGQRLDLWRLKNFDGTRLPAAAGTYLFHVVAKENPSDERLIALAEVRDVTTQLNESGEVIGVPAHRAHPGRVSRRHSPRAGPAGQEAARRQPRRALRVAGARHPRRPSPGDRAADSTAGGQCGAGRDHHPGEHQGRPDVAAQPGGDSLLVQPGRRHRRECDGAPDRAVAPARRVRAEGATLTGSRLGVPLRADPDSHRPRRQLRRIRPRRVRRAGTGGPSVWAQHRRPHRRRGDAAHGPLPRGNDPRRLVR